MVSKIETVKDPPFSISYIFLLPPTIIIVTKDYGVFIELYFDYLILTTSPPSSF